VNPWLLLRQAEPRIDGSSWRVVAVLDPDVVFRAGGARELQQELKGAADAARSLATFGPRLVTLCHPATVNGQAGLLVTTRQGPAGAIGFTISGGLITTIDLTLDPDKLEDPDHKEDARRPDPPHGHEADSELSLLLSAARASACHSSHGSGATVPTSSGA
jgi:hypothetical protein